MKNEKNANICYVFSQATLELAIEKWVTQKSDAKLKNHENYLIVAAAIPWFLKCLNQSASVYMFSHIDLVEEMSRWKPTQEAEYPHQKERIENTCNEIISFFQSEIVKNQKMTVQAK